MSTTVHYWQPAAEYPFVLARLDREPRIGEAVYFSAGICLEGAGFYRITDIVTMHWPPGSAANSSGASQLHCIVVPCADPFMVSKEEANA